MGRHTRRSFIKLAGTTALVAGGTGVGRGTEYLLEWQEPKPLSANDKIRIATIGFGGQGMSNTASALRVPGVEFVAAADVYDGRLLRAKEVFGEQVITTRDYREILARSDVDAVIIATPDHWHAQMSIDAMNAGKDVYVEKPMVHSIDEGQKVVEAQKKTNRICQVGSQRVSSIIYKKAKELYVSGAIGQLNLVEAWWNRNSAMGAWQYSIPPDASPETIDWDRFLGKAPRRPFDAMRVFRFRNYRDYGTGVAGDLFVHLFSGMHFILDSLGPERVMSVGGLRYWHDGREVPDVMLGLYDYPKTASHPSFNLFLKVNFIDGSGDNSGFRFVGSEGVMTVGGGVTVSRSSRPSAPGFTIDTFPKAIQEAFLKEYYEKYPREQDRMRPTTEESYSAPRNYSDTVDHFAVFFDSVRTRKPLIEDAVFGFRAAGPALVTNDSYFDNRIYGWDPNAMKVTGKTTR